jgi:hypothetical protein
MGGAKQSADEKDPETGLPKDAPIRFTLTMGDAPGKPSEDGK